MDEPQKKELLKTTALFSTLSDAEINYLVEAATEGEYPAEDILIWQDDTDRSLYIIIQGCVKVYRTLKNGENVNISILGKGEIVGEMSLLTGLPRSATVEALQETKVLQITYQKFQELLLSHPLISAKIISILGKRLMQVHQKLEQIQGESLVERTYTSLKILSEHFPEHTIKLSHEKLALLIGATRARVTEALHILEQENKITFIHRMIKVL